MGTRLCSLGALVIASLGCARVDRARSVGDGAAGGAGSDAAVDQPTASPPEAGRDVMAVDAPPACVNLKCQQVACAGTPTSLSGTVFAPNGKLPLYNVMVYVPNAPLAPFTAGVTCDRCGVPASGSPIVSTLSDSEGKFKLKNVPAGENIPLVFQVGKWRRKVTIPDVTPCQDNALGDPNLTRLPRNRTEGDLPKIAVATGDCDQLGCLLPKLGVDASELGNAGENKVAAYFAGSRGLVTGTPTPVANFGPANMRPATELWNDEVTLSSYDMTLLSCECSENLTTKTAASFSAMDRYLAKGGRVFGSHYTYVWLQHSPDKNLTSAVAIEAGQGWAQTPLKIDTSFPKGKALAEWMKVVDPGVVYGEIQSTEIFDNVRSLMPPSALAWASSKSGGLPPLPPGAPPAFRAPDGGYLDPNAPPRPRILTVNTPAGMPADKQCGRVAFLDAHIVDTTNNAPVGSRFPGNCGTDLSKGEEALAFLFFDLASCIQDDRIDPIVIP
ncbi:MAG TPA: carboxypeptidase regulatory-like domain-containing protein [Polyangia bacterium]|nr:carboxypeptidase regulatory-like domain-containing protein [Polyangia bacterium]